MGWFSVISVDGKPYRLMGGDPGIPGFEMDAAEQEAVIMTPTRTSYLFQAGPVTVNATYLSPVEVCPSSVCIYLRFLITISQKILYNSPYLSHIIIFQYLQILHIR